MSSPPSRPEMPSARRIVAAIDGAVTRTFDLVLSLLLLMTCGPLILLLAALVRRDSPGPAFYLATRVGRDGQAFHMLKLRTMVTEADRGAAITGAADRRVTRLGARLRATRLDELPQLVNVLLGQMAFVGPRPESPTFVADYTPAQRRVLTVRPGITGPTQLRFHDEASLLAGPDPEETYRRDLLPLKLASDLAYVDSRWLGGDLWLLARTAAHVLRRALARR